MKSRRQAPINHKEIFYDFLWCVVVCEQEKKCFAGHRASSTTTTTQETRKIWKICPFCPSSRTKKVRLSKQINLDVPDRLLLVSASEENEKRSKRRPHFCVDRKFPNKKFDFSTTKSALDKVNTASESA